MGHWQKIQYGKQVIITKLPVKYEGKDEITIVEKGKVILMLILPLYNNEN